MAAIKFSYGELDRRITTLEAEMEDLKRRMDKIERRSFSLSGKRGQATFPKFILK
jgi:chromosome condensin MukBEF ATPase and DNA-binding subunit MukB